MYQPGAHHDFYPDPRLPLGFPHGSEPGSFQLPALSAPQLLLRPRPTDSLARALDPMATSRASSFHPGAYNYYPSPLHYAPPPPQHVLDPRLSAFRPVRGLSIAESLNPLSFQPSSDPPPSQQTPSLPSLPTPGASGKSPSAGAASPDSLVQTLKTFLLPQQTQTPPSESSLSSASNDKVHSDRNTYASTILSPSLHGRATFEGSNVLCQVCGDRASGFHYGVHACEGCKGFFRRSIQQKIQYRPCTKNQQCSILRINRNRCQYCRLKKCIGVGMSRDAVRFGRVPKREKAKILAEMQRANAKTQAESLALELDDEDRVVRSVVAGHFQTCEFSREKLLPLLERYRGLGLSRTLSSVACPLNPTPNPLGVPQDLSERYSPAIRGVVDFARAVPGFHILSQEDQVTLLKAGMFEVLLLRLAVLFDSNAKTLMLLDGSIFRKEAPYFNRESGSHRRFLVDSLFDFMERFNNLGLNDADIAILCAIALISPDRPGLRNQELVEKMQERLKEGLRKVLLLNHPSQPNLFSQLLITIPDLRTLNTLHQEKLLAYRVDETVRGCPKSSCPRASESSRTRSPASEASLSKGDLPETVMKGSEWSTVCKASESPSSSSRGSAEAAHLRALHLSPISQKSSGGSQVEGASNDSGKGSLSHKDSSSSSGGDSDGEEGVGRLPPLPPPPSSMPTLKRALQAPPLLSDSDLAEGPTIKEKHQVVASLLERTPLNPFSPRQPHSGLTWSSSPYSLNSPGFLSGYGSPLGLALHCPPQLDFSHHHHQTSLPSIDGTMKTERSPGFGSSKQQAAVTPMDQDQPLDLSTRPHRDH